MNKRFGVVSMALLGGAGLGLPAESLTRENWYLNTLTTYTMTRLPLSSFDTPGSMTIIDKQFITEYGISSIEEALAYVPGMNTLHKSDINQAHQFLGTNAYSPRRMRVLKNGRALHNAHYAEINWALAPVDIKDVERIEVVRGPAASTWGNNAYLGVVNIITSHPEDTVGTAVSFRASELGDQYIFARQGGQLGTGFYNLRVKHKDLTGFESNAQGENRRDNDRVTSIDVSTFHNISDNTTIALEAGYSASDQEREYVHVTQVTWPDIEQEDWYVAASIDASIQPDHNIQLLASSTHIDHRQEWRSCAPTVVFSPALGTLYRSNPEYADTILRGEIPRGGTPYDDTLALATIEEISSLGPQASNLITCGDTNQNYDLSTREVELQYIYSFDDTMSIISGMGYRTTNVESITYYRGSRDQDAIRAFAHIIKRIDQWTFNTSASMDKEDLNGSNLSSKFAVNYNLDRHSFRVLWTQAHRTPDLREQAANWSYTLDNIDVNPFTNEDRLTFYPRDISQGNLDSESIISRELGYQGRWLEASLVMDVKFSHNTLYNLMSARGALGDFILDNNSRTTLKASELQINYDPALSLGINITYAYIDNNSTHINERTMTPRHSGTFSVVYRPLDNISLSLSYLGRSKFYAKPQERATTNIPGQAAINTDSGASLDNIRLLARKRFELNDTHIDMKIGAVHSLNNHPYSYANNNFDDRTRIWLELGLTF